jgi:hypothetical protein
VLLQCIKHSCAFVMTQFRPGLAVNEGNWNYSLKLIELSCEFKCEMRLFLLLFTDAHAQGEDYFLQYCEFNMHFFVNLIRAIKCLCFLISEWTNLRRSRKSKLGARRGHRQGHPQSCIIREHLKQEFLVNVLLMLRAHMVAAVKISPVLISRCKLSFGFS